jgi:hypothetical protein
LVLIGVTIPRCARNSAYATKAAQANDSMRSPSEVVSRALLIILARPTHAVSFDLAHD